MINIDLVNDLSFPQQEKHFSQGLRVLAIDDNVVCLKVLAFELQKCGYQVTITTKAAEAIELLKNKKDGYDIVITDVIRSDMDGFKLLEIIGLEMDIPVIMTSANSDIKIIEKGVKHGARDYLVKPVGFGILKNIWQHVIRKTTYNPKPAQKIETEMRSTRNIVLSKRHHGRENREATQLPDEETPVYKKSRVTWAHELHAKFVAAVQQLGGGAAVPKNILRVMNEPQLTRENVASHLQKYRSAALKQKERMLRQESKNHLGADRTRHLYDTNIPALSPDNNNFQVMNLYNTSGYTGNKSLKSQNPLLLPPDQHFGLFLQQQNPVVPPRDMNQIQQTMTIPVLTPSPILTIDPHCQLDSDFNAISSCHPSFQTTWSSSGISSQTDEPINGSVPYPCASGAVINHVGNSNHMHRDATSETTLFSQSDSMAGLQIPNSLPDREIHGVMESSPDDGLSAIVSQFSDDAAPDI